MTTTAQTSRAAGHDRPCWCDTCLGPSTLEDLLDERAKILHAAFLDQAYTPGLERSLAEELMHGIPAGRRAAALEYMVTWCHISPRVQGVDCLLDECDERTYTVIAEMAKILLDAIHAQDCASVALRILLTSEIDHRRELLAFA